MVAGDLRQLCQLLGRSEELMNLMTDRFELNVITDDCKLLALPFIPCLMGEAKLAVAIVSADWIVRAMM